MSETMMLSADGMREVWNARSMPIQKAKAHTMSVPLGMIVAGHQSVADLLNLVVLRGIPVQKNDDFTV